MNIGFIGLGIMGKPMATNLVRAGFDVWVNDLNPDAVKALCALGAHETTLEDIAAHCDTVLTMLPNGSIVHQVLLGDGGLLARMKPKTLMVDMSSVTPGEAGKCHEAAQRFGHLFLDAPVSGGEPKAIDGTLAFMVGGTQEAFDRAKPLFDCMGASALLVGGPGSGCVAKLSNQVIVNVTIAAVSEALVLAKKAGTDPEKVFQAIRGGLAGSAVLEAKAPMMLQRNFKPGGKISINMKDIKNVMATAHEADVPLPLTAQLLEIMTALKNGGHLEDDHSGIVQYYEQLAGIQVTPGEQEKH